MGIPADQATEGVIKAAGHSRRGVRHVEVAEASLAHAPDAVEARIDAFSGRFYTPRQIAKHMIDVVDAALTQERNGPMTICDPFAGDGRLALWLVEHLAQRHPDQSFCVELWDIDDEALDAASVLADGLRKRAVPLTCVIRHTDSFAYFSRNQATTFDVVITNPPWENLKPDRRYMEEMTPEGREAYVQAMRDADGFLAELLPHSQPTRKFAGWGTNLARPGFELACSIARGGGVVASVLPSSVFADQSTAPLRKWVFASCEVVDIALYPAEARLFGAADVSSSTIVCRRQAPNAPRPIVTHHDRNLRRISSKRMLPSLDDLSDADYSLPIAFGAPGLRLASIVKDFPRVADFAEGSNKRGLWMGRELDETGIRRFLDSGPRPNFIKGRMIDRFAVRQVPTMQVVKPGWSPPVSTQFERIVWRDISRPNQKRRIQATIIPANWIAGNSLGVAHMHGEDKLMLRWLLGVLSSLVFELQLRSILATGHVTLSALRKVRIPDRPEDSPFTNDIALSVSNRLDGADCEPRIEALVARQYGLNEEQLQDVLYAFPKLTDVERSAILKEFDRE